MILLPGRVRDGTVPLVVGDEWKTAYSAGFNSTTCALVRPGEIRAEGGLSGKTRIMGIMGIMGRMGGMGLEMRGCNLRATASAIC